MVEKTIIANYGDPETGKTQSIILAYKKLRMMAATDKVLHVDKDDVCAMMEINGVKVGICSQGDPRSCQKGWMETLVKEECTIILAACRPLGATVTIIENYRAKGYRIYWTSHAKMFEDRTAPRVAPKSIRNRFNEQWAEEIANLIDSWCYA